MRRPKTFLMLALGTTMMVALALMFATTGSAFAGGLPAQHQALFVQTDNTTANSIMVYDRAADGTLSYAATYPTGGMGGWAFGSQADPLASQGSLVTAEGGQLLLAVNAGSNTVSLFRVVNGDQLVLQQVINSGGTFPVSIAVQGDLVYVLNAGVTPVAIPGASSVSGFWLLGDRLWPIPGSSRTVGPTTTSEPFYLASPGQVGFSPDGRQLIVTTKFSGSAIDIFNVRPLGLLSTIPTVNVSYEPVPFAFSFDPWGRLVTVEVGGSGISTYTVNPNDSLTHIGFAGDNAVQASCWISAAGGFYYVSNAASGNISTYTLNVSGTPTQVGTPTTAAAGTTDSVTTPDGRFLYVGCTAAGEVLAFRVQSDGSLTLIQTVTGLPTAPAVAGPGAFEGIALN